MAKLTVLDMVQAALTKIGSDQVNSISDTQEAQDLSRMLRDTYFEFLGDRNWPHLRTVIQLDSLSDVTTPTKMEISDDIQKIDVDTMRYDIRSTLGANPEWSSITWYEPEQFLDRVMSRGGSLSNTEVEEVTDGEFTYYVINNAAPTFYTAFEDKYLVFDSYNNSVDSTLQSSKTSVIAYKEPTFTISDSHVPDLPSKNHPHLLAEFKAKAMNDIAQEIDPKEERQISKFNSQLVNQKWRTKNGFSTPDYGRNGTLSRGRRSWKQKG